jgi:uncharacterized protein with HEPN domain
MNLPTTPSARGIIDYVKHHHPELMDNNDKIRDFCFNHYPNINYRIVESTVRERRAYEHQKTPMEKKIENMLPGIKMKGINC